MDQGESASCQPGKAAAARASSFVLLLTTTCLTGCVGGFANTPLNAPIAPSGMRRAAPTDIVAPSESGGENVIALSISGGGTRAAAFSYGVLRGLESIPSERDGAASSLDDVGFVSAVSGGAITAAYFGLKGPSAYQDFDQKFLYQDVEAHLRTTLLNPGNVRRVLRGGLNDRATFGVWLDQNLFEGATFGDMYARGRPDVWINASDLYHHTPFPFTPLVFTSFCSDLSQLPLSEAVSASAAVPIAFQPIVIKRYPDACKGMPDWAAHALADPAAPRTVRSAAHAVEGYANDQGGRFIKLADGGLTDNFGLTSIVISRYASGTLYGPLSASDAIRLHRMVFLVVSSEQPANSNLTAQPDRPGIMGLLRAASATAIASTVRLGYDSFVAAAAQWRSDVIKYRCSLSEQERFDLVGPQKAWRCDDVDIRVIEINFDSLPAQDRGHLNAIPTALTLPKPDVDFLIDAGRRAVIGSQKYWAFDAKAAPKWAMSAIDDKSINTRHANASEHRNIPALTAEALH